MDMEVVIVVVTWMDGKKQVYNTTRHHVENGVLTIDQSTDFLGRPLPHQKTLHLPLANIREFSVESR